MFWKRLAAATLFSATISGGGAAAAGDGAHRFQFESIDGDPLAMETFAGRTVLVVNTASQCGFTKQYDALQALYDRYRERGLVVLGIPSNDFGQQEPGSADEIKEFCEVNFGIDFPMTAKTRVKGNDAHPFYAWAGAEVGMIGRPRWNFHKYLIGPDGRLIDWFSTPTSPLSDKITRAVETSLPPAG